MKPEPHLHTASARRRAHAGSSGNTCSNTSHGSSGTPTARRQSPPACVICQKLRVRCCLEFVCLNTTRLCQVANGFKLPICGHQVRMTCPLASKEAAFLQELSDKLAYTFRLEYITQQHNHWTTIVQPSINSAFARTEKYKSKEQQTCK